MFIVKTVDLAKLPEDDGKFTHQKIAMEGLKHSNICQIYDTFSEEGESSVNKRQKSWLLEVPPGSWLITLRFRL